MISLTDSKSAFTVYNPYNGPASGTIRFNNVRTDIGGHYNTSTGQFKCQYPGTYVFLLHILRDSGHTFAHCYIRKNKSNMVYVYTHPSSTSGYYSSSNTVVLHLVSGDVVDTGGCSDAVTMNDNGYNGYLTTFSGFLLQSD